MRESSIQPSMEMQPTGLHPGRTRLWKKARGTLLGAHRLRHWAPPSGLPESVPEEAPVEPESTESDQLTPTEAQHSGLS